MAIQTLKRVFKTGSTELQDPDPSLTPDEVRQHWTPNFPHLATATVSEPEQKGDTFVYTFEAPQAKTKGTDDALRKELSYEERATWGDCPVCKATHGQKCSPDVGIPLGHTVDGSPPNDGVHLGRLQRAPKAVRLVPCA